MFESCVKYFFFALCDFYFFVKLLNLPLSTRKRLYMLAMALLLAVVECYVRLYFPPAGILLFVLLLAGSMKLLYRPALNCAIVTAVLASGLSYFAFMLSVVLFLPIGSLWISLNHGAAPALPVSLFITGVIQCLLAAIPFRFSRLKNGMPFLRQYGASDTGVFISILLLGITLFFNLHTENDIYIAISIFLVALCGMALFFWWKRRLTAQYKERLKAEERERLEQTISQQKARIEALTLHNEELARVIHKDNKLIPAMELAVKELLTGELPDDSKEKAAGLLEQLTLLYDARTDILKNYESAHKDLPKTGILSTDGVIRYLLERANASGASFECSITGSVKFLTDKVISEADLNTLIADLGENALIAMGPQNPKQLLLRIGILDSHYQIDVLDSGPPFSPKVLYNLGLEETTTHADTGGSGIGLMNTWALLQTYNASFELDETVPGSIYTKRVSICLDGKRQYRIKTDRQALKSQCARSDILFL